ncbi:hypothetical protein H2199_009064 [Coniosporium tulheliwenetii]|uniref:Uncharacterized protein n=1 Tax=Coniosporium tulheliwenetii TaxID=3383036 RepID=A0ACC2YFZ9_9PEZI|nr:hypothetical protein H2199_009064 [Cladosporium sp. JES 115]
MDSNSNCRKQGAVVLVTSAEEVLTVVNIARDNRIQFVVSAERHSTGGASSVEGGIIIDLRKMRKVTVDPEAKTITAEGGCTWEDVDVEAAKYGLATVGGTVNHTGIGGLTLGGGFGWLSSKYGLTIDNLLSATMVLANGSIVIASSTENPDLFWAIRGCGASFGVAVDFTYRAYEQKDPVWAGLLGFTADKLQGIVKFANWHHGANTGDQCFLFGFSVPPPTNQPMTLCAVFFCGAQQAAEEYFAELTALGPVINQVGSMPYEKVNGMLNAAVNFGGRKTGGGSAVKLPLEPLFVQEVFDDFARFVGSHRGVGESLILFEIIPFKKIAEVPLEATAHGSRSEYYNVGSLFKWYEPELDATVRAFSRFVNQKIREQGGTMAERGVGAYSNYIEYQLNPEKIFGVNAEKLRQLKLKYDPENLFWRWHNVLLE